MGGEWKGQTGQGTFYFSFFQIIFPKREMLNGDAVQVRLLVEKGCDSEEKAGGGGGAGGAGGGEEESGEQLKEVLIDEFG